MREEEAQSRRLGLDGSLCSKISSGILELGHNRGPPLTGQVGEPSMALGLEGFSQAPTECSEGQLAVCSSAVS